MRLLWSITGKRIRFEGALNTQINIGVSWGKCDYTTAWEKFYIWIDVICLNIRISLLKP